MMIMNLAERVWLAAAFAIGLVMTVGVVSAGVLDRVAQEKTIRIAYREDAPPFSFKDKIGEPAGFMVDLCRAVAKKLAEQGNSSSLNVLYVPVTATDRFDAIAQQKADLLCEPTSATLSRRQLVDFSIPTFLDGASLMVRADGPKKLDELAGRKVGVAAGTTTEESLRNSLKDAGIGTDIVAAKTHRDGLEMLDEGKISAYFADRSILLFLIKDSKAPEKAAAGRRLSECRALRVGAASRRQRLSPRRRPRPQPHLPLGRDWPDLRAHLWWQGQAQPDPADALPDLRLARLAIALFPA
jgi:polar amino acid transport system substrate-binding protein/glutamate/aspartate transport system substrate-binding protein